MNRKGLKVAILVVAFGIPVSWYLFLQIFGENKFRLDVIEQLDDACLQQVNQIVYLPEFSDPEQEEELNRLFDYAVSRKVTATVDTECLNRFRKPILLIDSLKRLRGSYDMTIVEIDRAIVEIDLLLKLQQDDEDE